MTRWKTMEDRLVSLKQVFDTVDEMPVMKDNNGMEFIERSLAKTRIGLLPSAQPEPCEDKLKEIADALSEKMCYMNTCPNERDIILGYLGRKRSSKNHCNTDCWNEKCESYHCETKQQPEPFEDAIGVNLHVAKISKHSPDFSDLEEAEPCEDAVNKIKNASFTGSDGLDYVQTLVALDAVKIASSSAQPEIIRKPVIGYEGYYEVDNCGRVYALNRVIHVEDHVRSYDKHLVGGIIKQHMHSKGYKIVPLTKDGKTKNVFVHRIVAMAFLANPNKLPCINHKDEDKTNNFAENLEWCTYQYNNAYGSKPKKHSKWMSGRKLSDEHKQHMSDGQKRHWDKIRAERREGGDPSAVNRR